MDLQNEKKKKDPCPKQSEIRRYYLKNKNYPMFDVRFRNFFLLFVQNECWKSWNTYWEC